MVRPFWGNHVKREKREVRQMDGNEMVIIIDDGMLSSVDVSCD